MSYTGFNETFSFARDFSKPCVLRYGNTQMYVTNEEYSDFLRSGLSTQSYMLYLEDKYSRDMGLHNVCNVDPIHTKKAVYINRKLLLV